MLNTVVTYILVAYVKLGSVVGMTHADYASIEDCKSAKDNVLKDYPSAAVACIAISSFPTNK